ncbi:acyl-CoA dehydrogenase family protein [Mycolicibacterium thermoresistibile]|uniref:Acyl-CoA dehydrogenase n=2 Tax=Mycolicibacterium thermoresistibile TaxID=1797 RepID=G7CFT7_MYCT3|nr:acyl-CoA dehydrogenase family protein [Mycolicibacterium thermoresistibile]EHI13366.1 acyl-CoA dehydrogenase [Mycolicibacterium thermoresistibile ATCC 19527]MCV7189159.1 acyl-CoA dehydrogenase family protein [Mycolicibacterium thermoresistibile]GAT14651.1 acyl-CoA dehydrogenase [Mycolicibacterium thermoresistibile]SNW19878.1 acyl-CoA dehydrogenase [Mycolicibacterium thermoresistibile]
MDFNDTPEEARFRARLRQWLRDHSAEATIPDDPGARADAQNAWHQTLYEAGYIGLSFPVEYGGHGLPPIYEAILNDELGRAGAPPIEGVGHLSNALRLFGTDAQRTELLPGLLSGRVRWCQGFSEPEAGSDLAGLKTTANLVESDGRRFFRVNGRKIWTSFAAVADWCFLLCRTEPDAPKHQGISVLLIPMSTPGITVSPIVNAARNREFAEVTFDDVEVPEENLLGERGQGWTIANQLLAYERGPSDINWISRLSRQLRDLEQQVRSGQLEDSATTRARLGRAYTELRALQVKVQRSLTERQRGALPGPEGSVDKLLMARADQVCGHTMMDLTDSGPLLHEGLEWDIYVWSRAAGIYGGTAQIQRNIVAQRVLGLPRGR